jgi:hypothetical protein
MSTFCTFETEYRLTKIDQSLRRLSLSFTRCNSRIPRDLFGCHLSVSQWTHAVTGKPHPVKLRPYSNSKRSDDLSTKHEVAFCQLGEVRQLSSVSIGSLEAVDNDGSCASNHSRDQNRGSLDGGPRVRIPLPPAASLVRTSHARPSLLVPRGASWNDRLPNRARIVRGIIGDDLRHSVVLLRPDLPGIGTSLRGETGCVAPEARPSCACWQRPALPRIGARGREADGDVGPADGGLCLHRSATA